MNLPKLLKEVRKQLSLSQEDLARKLGISFATVNRWESGKVRPSKLAKAQLKAFYEEMVDSGKLVLPVGIADNAYAIIQGVYKEQT